MKFTMWRVAVVLNTYRKGDDDYFSLKLRVRIKGNNNSQHGKFHRFLFPFSSKFPDLNFASYVHYWGFSHDVTKLKLKTIDPPKILLS